MTRGLTGKQQAFCYEYIACNMNGTKAAIRAGYSARSASDTASENLRKPVIRDEIKRLLKDRIMPAEEVLARLSEQASASLEDCINIDADGECYIDLKRMARAGKLHLVKSFDKKGGKVELYDGQAALRDLARYHALFTDRVDLTDWRAEAARAGLDPDELKESAVQQFAELIRQRARTATG